MTVIWVVLGTMGAVVLAVASSYNRFVRQRNLIRDSWSNIDTELRRRHDLIPNLVETVKGYASHEKNTLEAVVQARNSAVQAQQSSQAGPEAQAQAERLIADAQSAIRRTEDELAALERFRRNYLTQLRVFVERQLAEITAAEAAPSIHRARAE